MRINRLIKKRATTRLYSKKSVSDKLIKQIIEAGIWGPSIHHFQPWKFVVVKNYSLIKKITKLVEKKLSELKTPTFITYPTLSTLSQARLLICVYNTKSFSGAVKKFNKQIYRNFEIAEISAISACIQNMILVIEDLKLGSCWLDMPLFCRREMNGLLQQNGELIAVLTVGYPLKKGLRSKRIPLSESTCSIS